MKIRKINNIVLKSFIAVAVVIMLIAITPGRSRGD